MSLHRFLLYSPRPSYTQTIFKIIGVDFVINSRESYKIASDNIFDIAWNFSQDKLFFYMVSCVDSPWAFRQIAASYLHAYRFGMNTCISCCDLAVSRIFDAVIPRAPVLNSDAAIHRSIRRMIGTMRRNGGVYRELSEIISNFVKATRISPNFEKIVDTISSYPCTDPPNGDKSINSRNSCTVENVEDQFEYETGIKFFSVFSAVDLRPAEIGDLIVHGASLATGERVSITVMKRNIHRMRSFDLIPFKLFNLLLKPIPFIGLEKKIYKSLLDRLTFSLGKERDAREKLLEIFGVDFTKAPSHIFSASRKIPLSFYIPAPIPHLCSENVMVTDVSPSPFSTLTKSDARQIVNFASDLLYKHHCIIADLSHTNLRKMGGRVSLSRFATLTHVDNNKFAALLGLAYADIRKDHRKAISEASVLGVSSEAVTRMVQTRETNIKVYRQALDQNAQMLLPFAEAAVGMANAVLDSKASYFTFEPFAIGAFAKMRDKSKTHSSFPYNLLRWTQYIPL